MRPALTLPGIWRAVWSPPSPLVATVVLVIAAATPVFVVGQLAPAAVGVPVVLAILALVAYSASKGAPTQPQESLRRVDAVRRLSAKASTNSIYDAQTGFCAEWYFLLRVEEEASRTKRNGRSFGILHLEVRKHLGDRLRDQVLLALERSFRTADLVGHLTSSRFAVLLPECEQAGVEVATQRLLDQVGQTSIQVDSMAYPAEQDWRAFLSDRAADGEFPDAEPIWSGDASPKFEAFDRTAKGSKRRLPLTRSE